jgi:hypothetical protein
MIERGVVEGQRLGRCGLDLDARDALPARLDERGRRVDRRDPVGAEHSRELAGQRAWPAADVQGTCTRPHAGGVDDRAGELVAVAADEAVVGLRRLVEGRRSGYVAHAPSLPAAAAGVKRAPGLATSRARGR